MPTRKRKRECPTPGKKRYSRAEATQTANALNQPGREKVFAYRCPTGDHSHVGRRLRRFKR